MFIFNETIYFHISMFSVLRDGLKLKWMVTTTGTIWLVFFTYHIHGWFGCILDTVPKGIHIVRFDILGERMDSIDILTIR